MVTETAYTGGTLEQFDVHLEDAGSSASQVYASARRSSEATFLLLSLVLLTA